MMSETNQQSAQHIMQSDKAFIVRQNKQLGIKGEHSLIHDDLRRFFLTDITSALYCTQM